MPPPCWTEKWSILSSCGRNPRHASYLLCHKWSTFAGAPTHRTCFCQFHVIMCYGFLKLGDHLPDSWLRTTPSSLKSPFASLAAHYFSMVQLVSSPTGLMASTNATKHTVLHVCMLQNRTTFARPNAVAHYHLCRHHQRHCPRH